MSQIVAELRFSPFRPNFKIYEIEIRWSHVKIGGKFLVFYASEVNLNVKKLRTRG